MIFSFDKSIDGSVENPMSPSPRAIPWSSNLLKVISVFCATILLLLLLILCTIWGKYRSLYSATIGDRLLLSVIKRTEEPTFRYVTAYNKEGKLLRKEDIEKTTVDVLKPIIFLINGLDKREASSDMWCKDLLEGYLEKQIQNVFLVEWHFDPKLPNLVKKIQSTGTYLAEFISGIFSKTKETYLDIHLIGVLVGSQVAAVAGERLWELAGRKVNRITALNPNYYVINMGIDIRNANFIDVVYNAKELGQDGHVRFYVDGRNCKEGKALH